MKTDLVLSARDEPRVRLRAAGPGDLESLRSWKNAHRTSFFFQGEITPQMQAAWYAAYRERPGDFMFVVEHEGRACGCMGFRATENGAIDAYNIIAAPGAAGRGLMRAGMALMCSYAAAAHGRDIGCLVLKSNPATAYYERCGFRIAGDGGDHHVLKLDWSRFRPVAYDILEG
jgi:RimJ/RimL family protein N-acetyltransferase